MPVFRKLLLLILLSAYSLFLCMGSLVCLPVAATMLYGLSKIVRFITRGDLHSGLYFIFPFNSTAQWTEYLGLIRTLIRTTSFAATFRMPYYKYRKWNWDTNKSLPYFHFPNITSEKYFYNSSDFPGLELLVQNQEAILAEYQKAIPLLKPYYNEAGLPHQDWLTLLIYGTGKLNENARIHFPLTLGLLEKIDDLEKSMIMFSVLKPGAHIPIHSGPFNAFLRVHLPLILPDNPDRCKIRVGNEIHSWEPGRLMVFDDGFLHEVHNETGQPRVILLLSVWKPDIPDKIKPLVTRFIDLLNSSPPFQKWMTDNR